jgi:hypothetical protein
MVILSPLFEEHYYQTELEKFGYEISINEEIYLEQDDYNIFFEYLSEGFTLDQNAKIKLAGNNKVKEAKSRLQDNLKTKTYEPGFLRRSIDKFGATTTGGFINRGLNSDLLKPVVNRIKYGIADRVAKNSGLRIGKNLTNIKKQQEEAVGNAFNKKKFNTNFDKHITKLDKNSNKLTWALQYRRAHESEESSAARTEREKKAEALKTANTPPPNTPPPINKVKTRRKKQTFDPQQNPPPVIPQTNTTAQNISNSINKHFVKY